MNFSKFSLAGAASVLTLSTLAPTSFAAVDETKSTKATVTFTAEGDGETTNLLSLDFGPVIDFSSQSTSLENKTYNTSSMSPSLQVTDLRGGGGLGWNVTAKASPFYKEGTDGTVQLNGAEINFEAGTATSDTNFDSPIPEAFVLKTDGTADSVMNAAGQTGLGTWHLDWNSESADESTGNDKITLTVPAGSASEGTYTSTLTWTLSNTPTN